MPEVIRSGYWDERVTLEGSGITVYKYGLFVRYFLRWIYGPDMKLP